jgi:pre-mRNA-splicing factor ISY1
LKLKIQKLGPRLLDKEGREVPGSKGYKYFGAAKDLPGVKELFEQDALNAPKKTRAELMKEIDAEYYGYIDDEDYLLVEKEEQIELEARRKKIEEFMSKPQNAEMEINEIEEAGLVDAHNQRDVSLFFFFKFFLAYVKFYLS